MVIVNFTFFVLLALFLGFLWAMHRFVFRPLLSLMDQREARIAEDKESARRTSLEATALEDGYATKLAAIHHEASLRLMRTRRTVQEEHNNRVDEFRKAAEAELRVLRKALRSEVKSQTSEIAPLAESLAAAMAAKLELP